MIHSEGRGIILSSMRSDITLFIYGLESFIYLHPHIYTVLKKESTNKKPKILPEVEVLNYNHSWRFRNYFKYFLFEELTNIEIFQSKLNNANQSYDSFAQEADNMFKDLDMSTNKYLLNLRTNQNRKRQTNYVNLIDFGFVIPLIQDEERFDKKDFYFLIANNQKKHMFVDLTCLSMGKINRYFLIRRNFNKKVFKAIPILSMCPSYLKLKFLFIEMLLRDGCKEMSTFLSYERRIRNNLTHNLIRVGKNHSGNTFADDLIKIFSSLKDSDQKDFYYRSVKKKTEIGGFNDNLLPVYVFKNQYGARPELDKEKKHLSILGPLGSGLPFNNTTNKTYLFGRQFSVLY